MPGDDDTRDTAPSQPSDLSKARAQRAPGAQRKPKAKRSQTRQTPRAEKLKDVSAAPRFGDLSLEEMMFGAEDEAGRPQSPDEALAPYDSELAALGGSARAELAKAVKDEILEALQHHPLLDQPASQRGAPRGTAELDAAHPARPKPARAHRRRPAHHHQNAAVREQRPSQSNEQLVSPSVGAPPFSFPGRRRAALGGLTVAVVVLAAAVGMSAFAGGRTPRRAGDHRTLARLATIQTALLAPVDAKFAHGYAVVMFAARRVGVKVERAAARRRRELALTRRREAAAAAQAARARAAAAAAAASAPQASPDVNESSGSSGGASPSSIVPRASSTGSSSSQSSSGAATSSGSSGSTTTSTPTKTGPICYPGTLGCWPGGPATK